MSKTSPIVCGMYIVVILFCQSCVRYFAATCTPSVPNFAHIDKSPGHVFVSGVSDPLLLKAITKCGVGFS